MTVGFGWRYPGLSAKVHPDKLTKVLAGVVVVTSGRRVVIGFDLVLYYVFLGNYSGFGVGRLCGLGPRGAPRNARFAPAGGLALFVALALPFATRRECYGDEEG